MSRDRAPCRKEINFKNIDHGVCLLLRSNIRLFLLEIDHFRSRSLAIMFISVTVTTVLAELY